jgi:hypothetical protein
MSLNMNNASPVAKQRQLITAGQHMARIVQVIDMGLQKQPDWQGQAKPPAYMMHITFEFPNERIDIQGESKPMWKSRDLKLSNHEMSICYKWYKKLDPNNEFKGDWSKLINKECAILVIHEEGKGKNAGKTYDKIADVMPLMAGMTVPPLENDPHLFELTSPNLEVFEAQPDWLQNKIKENLEYENSKLYRLLNQEPIQYTARADGDAPIDQDADDPRPDTPTPAVEEDVDGDEPW